MQKKFLSNLILLLVLNFLVKPFYVLGIDTEIQNRVGTEEYGSYFALVGFAFIFNIVLDMGINNFNTRQVAQDENTLSDQFSRLFTLRFILFVGYMIIIYLASFFLDYSDWQQHLLLLIGVVQGLAMTVLFLRSNLSGLHLFKQDSIISVLDRVLLIVILGVLLWGNIVDGFRIEWFIYSQIFAYLVTALVALFLVLKHVKSFKFSFDKMFSKELLRKSLPFALLTFLMMLYYRTDSVMLERMLVDGDLQAGIYAKGYRYFEAANMIAYLFAVLLMPIFSRMLKNKEDVSNLVLLSFKIIFSGALILSVLCYFYSNELLALRYVEQLSSAAPVFGLLMISFLFVCIAYIFGTLLTANGSLKTLNRIALLSVILNVVLNIILIPIFQAWGAALASVITLVFSTIVQVVLSFKMINLSISRKNIGSIIIFALGVIIFSQVGTIFSDFWLYNAVLFVSLSLIWAFVTKMLSIANLLAILKSK